VFAVGEASNAVEVARIMDGGIVGRSILTPSRTTGNPVKVVVMATPEK
jgi:hypothetical protein